MQDSVFKNHELNNRFKLLVMAAFYIMGFFFYYIYIPIAIIMICCLGLKENGFFFKKKLILTWVLLFSSIILPFYISVFDDYYANTINSFLVALFYIVTGLYIISRLSFEFRKIALEMYFFGLFSNSVMVAISTYIIFGGDQLTSYGSAYHPLYMEYINTPILSNSLVPFSLIVLYRLFVSGTNHKFPQYFTVVLLSFVCGLYYGGRAYFIVLGLAMMLLLVFNFKIKFFITLLLLSALVFSFFTYLNEINLLNTDFILDRFMSNDITEDSRVGRYMNGFESLINTPIGRFYLDSSTYDNDMFHNIFLDYSKYLGWLPFVSLFILLLSPFFFMIRKARCRDEASILFFSIFLILQQDVFFAAGFSILFGFIIIFFHMYSTEIS